ncbi:hypothetical protein NQ318_001239 [Aromia moschata]|uniref:Uncharacterized protein n=1 Tax=Aromia moschata TaxID=1265417 RepID=A0AAV8ZEB8_9CUCU|nr:hypothetical protein NQ318_001239 [Aromia moschata]
MVSNTDLGFLALTLVDLKRKKQQKKKRRRSKESYKMRNRFTHVHLLNFLRDSEPEDYRNFLRMDQESFDYLLESVRPDIEMKDTNMCAAISANQRLSITLRYLASDIDLENLKFTCAIAPQTLEFIIMETCSAITKSLKENIQPPATTDITEDEVVCPAEMIVGQDISEDEEGPTNTASAILENDSDYE